MSDSTSNLDLVIQSQASKEVTINALADAGSPATIYGRRQSTCSGLTWGYYGGRWGGFSTANGTILLGASTTTYMVIDKTNGAVSFDTATTDWDDDVNYARAYKIVTGASSVTSYEDHRAGEGGTMGGGGGGGGGVADLTYVASAPTTASIYPTVGNLYGVDISGMTGGRYFILPDTAAVDDRIGVVITKTHETVGRELVLSPYTGSGDTINGITGDWSRIWQVGELLVFRCIVADTKWVVEIDGRIAQSGRMSLKTTDIATSSAGSWNNTVFNSIDIERGLKITLAGTYSKMEVRRGGTFFVSAAMQARNVALADQEQYGPGIWKNGGTISGTPIAYWSAMRTSGTIQQGANGVDTIMLTNGDHVSYAYLWGTTVNAGLRALSETSFMSITEIL